MESQPEYADSIDMYSVIMPKMTAILDIMLEDLSHNDNERQIRAQSGSTNNTNIYVYSIKNSGSHVHTNMTHYGLIEQDSISGKIMYDSGSSQRIHKALTADYNKDTQLSLIYTNIVLYFSRYDAIINSTTRYGDVNVFMLHELQSIDINPIVSVIDGIKNNGNYSQSSIDKIDQQLLGLRIYGHKISKEGKYLIPMVKDTGTSSSLDDALSAVNAVATMTSKPFDAEDPAFKLALQDVKLRYPALVEVTDKLLAQNIIQSGNLELIKSSVDSIVSSMPKNTIDSLKKLSQSNTAASMLSPAELQTIRERLSANPQLKDLYTKRLLNDVMEGKTSLEQYSTIESVLPIDRSANLVIDEKTRKVTKRIGARRYN